MVVALLDARIPKNGKNSRLSNFPNDYGDKLDLVTPITLYAHFNQVYKIESETTWTKRFPNCALGAPRAHFKRTAVYGS